MMNDFFIPQSTYDKLVREIGREAADRIVASGAPVRPDEVEFQPYNSVDVGGDNGMDEEDNVDLAVATEDAADDTADEGVNLAVGPKTDELSQWESSQAAFMRKAQAQRKKQFEDAKAYIEQNYRGPSLSEQLFAMSEALLSPRSMPGFKGTMSNIAPVFGQIAKAQRTSAQQRAEALAKLQQQYQSGEIEAEGDALKNQLAVIRARAAANKPQWARTQDPVTGEVTLTPVYPGQQPPSGMKPPPSPENTRTIKAQTDLIKLPPNVLYFIAESDPTKTPREIPGR